LSLLRHLGDEVEGEDDLDEPIADDEFDKVLAWLIMGGRLFSENHRRHWFWGLVTGGDWGVSFAVMLGVFEDVADGGGVLAGRGGAGPDTPRC